MAAVSTANQTSVVSATASTVKFTRDMKMGSEGADATSLQTFLESKGFLKMPKGIAKDYFGQATKKALMQYQISINLEAVGVLGPKTRAALNSAQ